MRKVVTGIVAVVTGVIGATLTFVDPRVIVKWGLGFGRHNDRVLVGVLLIEIAIVAIYTLIAKKKAVQKATKPAKKSKKRKK
ncbi:MAG: hypothetical protein AABY01_03560 [Nanoarchaeota archaeon]